MLADTVHRELQVQGENSKMRVHSPGHSANLEPKLEGGPTAPGSETADL